MVPTTCRQFREPRSRGGLVRIRGFIMKDAYSFHATQEDLDAYYPRQCRAYRDLRVCGVPVTQVLGDVGMMGVRALTSYLCYRCGRRHAILCPGWYAANREAATILKEPRVGFEGSGRAAA